MYKKLFLVILALLLLFVIACAYGATTKAVSEDRKSSESGDVTMEKSTWQVEWERILKEAKKEGKVVVLGATPGSAVRQAMTEGFMKKHAISVELIQVPRGTASQKISRERRARLYSIDIFFARSDEVLDLGLIGALDPLEPVLFLPEVVDQKVWWKGKLDFIDSNRSVLSYLATPMVPLAINTNLVKPTEEPRRWEELLDPKWKGKLLMSDPRIIGGGNILFTVITHYMPELGLSYWQKLAKQEPVILQDSRLLVDWLAKGKYPIVISPAPVIVTEFIEAGAPLKNLMPQGKGALSSASVALVNEAPHPNAAKVYINWLLTREAQTSISVATGFQSGRVDVPTDHLDPLKVRQTGVDYIETSHKDFFLKSIEDGKLAREIFGQ